MIDLQSCISFRYIAKWFSCVCVYIIEYVYILFKVSFPYGLYKILSIVSCAIWKVLVIYFIFRSVYIWLYSNLRDFRGKDDGTPLQYSCLENPMDRGAWWAAVHGVAKSRMQLSDFTFTFNFHALEKEMATHSSVLAWRIPGTGEPGGLPSMGSHRVRHD